MLVLAILCFCCLTAFFDFEDNLSWVKTIDPLLFFIGVKLFTEDLVNNFIPLLMVFDLIAKNLL